MAFAGGLESEQEYLYLAAVRVPSGWNGGALGISPSGHGLELLGEDTLADQPVSHVSGAGPGGRYIRPWVPGGVVGVADDVGHYAMVPAHKIADGSKPVLHVRRKVKDICSSKAVL